MKRPKGFMDAKLFVKLIRELKNYKCPVRFIRWGEPTLHPQWVNFFKIASAEVLVHVNTNGIQVDPDELLFTGVHSIKVSIHTKKSYEFLEKLCSKVNNPDINIVAAYLSSEQQYDNPKRADGVPLEVTISPTHNLSKCRRTKSCTEVFNKLSVDWDGIVTACCGDYDRMMKVGNANLDTLAWIWNFSSRLKKFQTMIEKKRFDELELCRRCARNGND